ncbi:serine/threonine-protein kinase pim-2-like isoform X2 [Hypomesus transpacificus]|uniref:serine/threonine-protein kinase pim-2-like isoform X2 n=1 Tax=Hypomesus transpacificus TaxID=137520 RepID=UPI001F08735C|nr:serine/threonine-protein kinase pim-2-like isoform X2 [Hypomesus transpacificus]
MAPYIGPKPCLVSVHGEPGEEEQWKEEEGKRKRESSFEGVRKGRVKEIQLYPKKIGGLRKDGTGRHHLPVKQIATESNCPSGRAEIRAGYCHELDRWKRLAFGPALGTRSMARWRQISGTVLQHPHIPSIHYKQKTRTSTATHNNTQRPASTKTKTLPPENTNTNRKTHATPHTCMHTPVSTTHTTKKAGSQRAFCINAHSNPHCAVESQRQQQKTKRTLSTCTHDKPAQDLHTLKKVKCTPPTQLAEARSPHPSQTPAKTISPRNTDIPTRARKERYEQRYVKGELIGNGGYGSVYAGFRKSDNQPVALKFMDQLKIKMWAKMLENEDALPLEIALLRHVCRSPRCKEVAQLLDYYWFPGPEGVGVYLLILERPIPCMDLFNYMQEEKGYLEEGMARQVMKQVVSALQHCHSRGVVHRDLKPENILIQMTNYNVMLLDFGSASVLKEGPYTEVAGTPEYFPPETVLKGEYFALPATVWSLGILLFQMVWGDVPFYNDASIAKATIYFPRGISRDCRHLIRRCLAVCPHDRPTLEQIQEHPWMQ